MAGVLKKHGSDLISRLFFGLLPIQILIFAMGSINSIVDGVMAGRFIDSSSVGVVGLYYTMVNVINAIGSVLLGGSAVLCGRYLGRGDIEKTRGIFSLNISASFTAAAVLTAVSIMLPGPIADILGASDELKQDLVRYIMGYAIGIIPMMLAQQIASFLQLERQSVRGYIGIAGMVSANIFLDVLLVAVLRMGITGLALATSLSNWVYFLILAPYYLTKKANLKYDRKNILWSELPGLVKIGFPGALLVFCLAIRAAFLNRILLHYSGNDGLSALSAFNMISGIFIAYCVGNGNVVRTLISVFVGEEDKASMKKVLGTVLTKGMLMSVILAAAVATAAPLFSGLFFPDRTSEVYRLTYQLFVIYGLSIPLVLLIQIITNYMQAIGRNFFVNIMSVVDGLLSVLIPSAILAPVMGALGVWLANPIGLVLTLLISLAYIIICCKGVPKRIDEWMLLSPTFGVSEDDCLDIPIRSMEDASGTAELVQDFCDRHDMAVRPSYYAALCLEEMAGNVVKHGFSADRKQHYLNARAVFLDDAVMLRLKDDCMAFDPSELAELAAGSSDLNSLGLKMVYRIADDVNYQNLLGLNVLTIMIKDENLAAMDANDYLLERKLKEVDPELHRIFRDNAVVSQQILSRFTQMFNEYNENSQLHSLAVIDSCNRLIGRAEIENLNKDEAFILLVACYLHDIGMAIGEHEYEEFSRKLGADEYFKEHPDDDEADFVRVHHNEFSELFIEKYADLFDLPSDEHEYALKQVIKGHRKADLTDEKEYPAEYPLPNGNSVCLPYLAALLRLSDEIDVVASKNPMMLYDIDLLSEDQSIEDENRLLMIETVRLTRSAFILETNASEKEVLAGLGRMIDNMQESLNYCRDVVTKRTKFNITQKRVVLRQKER